MKNKLFMATLAAAMAIPVMVSPVQAEEIETINATVTDFIDVPKTHSAYKEITAMRAEGIINGYDDNTFKPAAAISRQHVAALISRALPLDPIREAKEFNDVPKTHPYYEEIQRLYRAGIIDGTDGKFNPSASLTRAHMAKILVNAFKLEPKTGYIFTDVGADHWAKDYIATLYTSGITTGDNGLYKPSNSVSRAHYAVFLYRALHPEDAPKPDKPLSPDPIKPEEEKPKPPTGIIPSPDEIVVPPGWTEEKIKEYDKIVDETVFTHSPMIGHGSLGTAKLTLVGNKHFTLEEQLKMSLEGINSRGGNITYDEYVVILNDIIQNGTIYVHPNNVFAMYYNYEDGFLYRMM